MATNNQVNVSLSGTNGSGFFVGTTSPVLVTPHLGTPSSGTLTNCTGLPVSGSGTGASSFTAYSVICAGTTSTGAFQNVSGVGTSGQVLMSNDASALPSWEDSTQSRFLTQNNVSGSRSTNTVYQNTTGNNMYVAITLNGFLQTTTALAQVDSSNPPTTIVAQANYSETHTYKYQNIGFLVLNNYYYQINTDLIVSIVHWTEWY